MTSASSTPTPTPVPRVTFDDLYRRSTQYRMWSFTKEELADVRTKVNAQGHLKVDERLAKTPEVDPSLIEKVSVEEELELISFHLRGSLTKLSGFFNMPSQVRATAVSFFRKFYLVHSVLEYHPKFVLLTCLFLAAKSENYFISINTFCKKLAKMSVAPESILNLEFTILESLKFTLLTHHPFRPLYGFFFDIQDTLGSSISQKELGSVYDAARTLVNEALISDVVYHFTPPQIALACFKEINSEITMKYLEKKFNHTIKEEPDAENENSVQEVPRTDYDMLLEVINECQVMIKTAKNPTKEKAVAIDKKVQFCINPALVLKRKRESPGAVETEDPNKRLRTESPAV